MKKAPWKKYVEMRKDEIAAELQILNHDALAVVQPMPCPFCGETAIEIWAEKNPDEVDQPPFVQCGCTNCTAVGPIMDKPADAVAAWNARADVEPKIEVLTWCVSCSKNLEREHDTDNFQPVRFHH
jgi:Lar family restriction alleviation protein